MSAVSTETEQVTEKQPVTFTAAQINLITDLRKQLWGARAQIEELLSSGSVYRIALELADRKQSVRDIQRQLANVHPHWQLLPYIRVI